MFMPARMQAFSSAHALDRPKPDASRLCHTAAPLTWHEAVRWSFAAIHKDDAGTEAPVSAIRACSRGRPCGSAQELRFLACSQFKRLEHLRGLEGVEHQFLRRRFRLAGTAAQRPAFGAVPPYQYQHLRCTAAVLVQATSTTRMAGQAVQKFPTEKALCKRMLRGMRRQPSSRCKLLCAAPPLAHCVAD